MCILLSRANALPTAAQDSCLYVSLDNVKKSHKTITGLGDPLGMGVIPNI